jgi:hypothetical protein
MSLLNRKGETHSPPRPPLVQVPGWLSTLRDLRIFAKFQGRCFYRRGRLPAYRILAKIWGNIVDLIVEQDGAGTCMRALTPFLASTIGNLTRGRSSKVRLATFSLTASLITVLHPIPWDIVFNTPWQARGWDYLYKGYLHYIPLFT